MYVFAVIGFIRSKKMRDGEVFSVNGQLFAVMHFGEFWGGVFNRCNVEIIAVNFVGNLSDCFIRSNREVILCISFFILSICWIILSNCKSIRSNDYGAYSNAITVPRCN